MGYGSFFVGSAALLLALVLGAWILARRRVRSAAARSRFLNLATVLLTPLASLVLAEGIFFFFVDTTDATMATLTSRRWAARHLPRPQPQRTYRGRREPSADAGTLPTLHIVVLGDSITYGQGIEREEDLYSSLLERELRARGIAIDVYNISAPGWNTGEELLQLWQEFEAGAAFDAVVLGFCLNDIGTFVKPSPGFKQAVARLKRGPGPLGPLVANSFVASFLYSRYQALTSSEIAETWKRVAEAYRVPETYTAMTKQLESVKRLTDSYGVPLMVTTFPDTTYSWDEYPYRDIHTKLDEFWTGLGVPHVDLLPAFERHPVRSLQAGIFDAHPNELGHRLAAAELAELLAKLVQPPSQGREAAQD